MSLSNFHIICYCWIGFGILAFVALQYLRAPYGKFISNNWGKTMSNKSGWIFMEAFVLVVVYTIIFNASKTLSVIDWIIIGLFTIHYINRSFIYPFRTKTKGKQIPISIVALALFHNLVNGFLIAYFVSNFSEYSNSWLLSWQFIVGITLFFFGMYMNIHSDNILIHLRTNSNDGYKIPFGGAFRYISSPNLAGEMIEWIGFAILSWSLPTFCFAFFTFCNLFPRAISNHRWYLQKFPDYPRERKAVIPNIL